MAAALLLVGVALVVAGVAWIFVPAGLITAGVAAIAGAIDLTRRTPAPAVPAAPE